MTIADYPFAEISAAAETSPGSRWLPWPVAGNPGGLVNFASYAEWRDFFLQFNLHSAVPEIVKAKFTRAMKLHLLAWIDTLVDLSANTGHHLGTYSAADLRLVRRAMIVRMIRMLMQRYKAGQRAQKPNWRRLETFFDEFNERTTAVLSMNWDTVIESGLSRRQSIDKIEYGCEAKFVEFV
ncbi:hypothetical protein ACU8OJ_25310 (plasmid) [Rhizobium leguminosarum]